MEGIAVGLLNTREMNVFPFVFPESWPGCCSSHHHLCQRESDWFLQALHDTGDQYLVPEAQRDQPRRFLLFKPPLSRYLDVCPPGLPWSQLCPLCHCQVRPAQSFRYTHSLSSHRCWMGSGVQRYQTIHRGLSNPKTFLQSLGIFSSTLLFCIALRFLFKGCSKRSSGMHQEAAPQQMCAEKQSVTCMQAFPFSTQGTHSSKVKDPKGERGFAAGPALEVSSNQNSSVH